MGSGSSTEIQGVRVFKVIPGSPAAEAGLEVFFDFILEADGARLDPQHQQVFAEKIGANENKPMRIVVYNARVNATREVMIVPRKWAGTGLLGATVRFDTVDPADTHGIRVLEVFPNSPAAHAGLVPFQDFLLGTTQSAFRDIDELVEAVTSSTGQRLQVAVYNTDSEMVREVVMVPNNDWGGEGCIGCDIGSGLLHRIPTPRRKPSGVPPAVASVAPTTSAPSITGLPGGRPGIPPVPAAPAGGGLPGIKVGGSWAPPTPGVPGLAAAVDAGLPAPAYPLGAAYASAPSAPVPAIGVPSVPAMPAAPTVPASVPRVQMPPMPMNGFPVPAAALAPASAVADPDLALARGKVSSMKWPPVAEPTSPVQDNYSLGQADKFSMSPGAPMTPGGPELPRAPPCTPMGGVDADYGPLMDLSSLMAKAEEASFSATPVTTPTHAGIALL